MSAQDDPFRHLFDLSAYRDRAWVEAGLYGTTTGQWLHDMLVGQHRCRMVPIGHRRILLAGVCWPRGSSHHFYFDVEGYPAGGQPQQVVDHYRLKGLVGHLSLDLDQAYSGIYLVPRVPTMPTDIGEVLMALGKIASGLTAVSRG